VDVHDKLARVFQPIEKGIHDIESKVQRINDIHLRKLKNVDRTIRYHTK